MTSSILVGMDTDAGTAPPRIWYDFNAVGRRRLPLVWKQTLGDLAENGVEMREGQALILYEENGESDGTLEWMLVDAVLSFGVVAGEWVALADWKTFRREPRPYQPKDGRSD